MKKEKFTPSQEALKLLTNVPSKDFIIDNYTDKIGKCCAIGHLMRLKSKNPNDYSLRNCNDGHESTIRQLSQTYLNVNKKGFNSSIASVNNSTNIDGYKQKTPKARVIALLKDMVKEGF